jgi:hypothetical protein
MATRNPLHRLYRTKLMLLAVVSFFSGLTLMFWAAWAEGTPGWDWVSRTPINEIGNGLFFAGLFGVLFQYVGQRDAEELSNERFRKILVQEAPAIRKAVIDGFALEPSELTRVAAPATLDKVIENCLAIRLGDKEFAADIYADLRDQAIRASERHFDKSITVSLAPAPGHDKRPMFVATVRYEFRVTAAPKAMSFVCTSSIDEYRERLGDPSAPVIYFAPVGKLDGASEDVFQLESFQLNGMHMHARRTSRGGTQIYTVALAEPEQAHGPVTISYTYRFLVQQRGHLFHVDVAYPTKNLKIAFHYGGCGIRHVNVIDYIASAQRPRISSLPAAEPTPSIEVGFDGWVLPKAGTAFVWVLDSEMKAIGTA